MTELPGTSPVPPLVFAAAQSLRTASPTPTPAPQPPQASTSSSNKRTKQHSSKDPAFPLPKLRLEIRDLNHDGTEEFLTAVIANKAIATAVQSVLSTLYHSPDYPTTTAPSTRSVTLILRPMGGVAYTTGSDLDSDHKEIHFSLDYIRGIASDRKKDEIMGVLTHEMVHCYQYDAFGTCPGGLVEGIADFVRLNSNLSPPHWKKEATGSWDAGYQHTAYFLEYLEKRFGNGTIRRLNEKLRIERYEEKKFWTELCGRPVEQLWGDYRELLEKEKRRAEEEECVMVEKEDASTPKMRNSMDGGSVEPTPTTKANKGPR